MSLVQSTRARLELPDAGVLEKRIEDNCPKACDASQKTRAPRRGNHDSPPRWQNWRIADGKSIIVGRAPLGSTDTMDDNNVSQTPELQARTLIDKLDLRPHPE